MDRRSVTPDEMRAIPGIHFLTHVGTLRSEETPGGSRHVLRAVVRASSNSPIMRGRVEWTHLAYIEASNNISHWITSQVSAVTGVLFKVPVVFPRGMGMPPLRPDEDIDVSADVQFQREGDRWRGEVEVRFFRADGSRAETVSFPLLERGVERGTES